MLYLVSLLAVVTTVSSLGSGDNPAWGTCLCLTGTSVRIRSAASTSSTVLGYASTGECYKSKASRLTSGGYVWFKIDYNGKDGWTAGNYLKVGSASQCASGQCAGVPSSGNTKMSHSAAKSALSAAGIPVVSSGSCSDRYGRTCTSLEQMRAQTVCGIITFKKLSGCSMTVTGGTETGHASGTYSHWKGYKIDIGITSCLDNYIQGKFTRIADRGSHPQYVSGDGTYAREYSPPHWDITFK